MKCFYGAIIALILTSCASYSPMNEKEWVKDHIDTGELNKEAIANGKVMFTGSVKQQYSNISVEEVEDISLDFFNMLQTKYGKENVTYAKSEEIGTEIYEISYEILNNEVTNKNNKSGRTECFISTRNVSVNLSVTNTQSKDLIWGGVIDKELESSNCTERSEIKSESLGGVFIEALITSAVESTFDAVTGTYKNPPSAFKVASRAILGFYKTMP